VTDTSTTRPNGSDAPDGVPTGSVTPDLGEALDASSTEGLSTAPKEEVRLPRLSPRELARWAWRQLTSMRIALVLFLLSLAAVPGSLLPQRPVNPQNVAAFYQKHKFWAPIISALGGFNVFTSVWFAAIYLLLFVSLIGCIVPRTRVHFRAMRTPPPRAPRHLRRLPEHRRWHTEASQERALRVAEQQLRARRFRVHSGSDAHGGYVAAEKGYLREVGNLLFHVALLGVFAAVAIGHFFGYKGIVLVNEGATFSDTRLAYNEFTPGTEFHNSELPPFEITLNRFDAEYIQSGPQMGTPSVFKAHVSYRATPTSAPRTADIQVNHPLVVHGVKVFLQGHGYAPEFTVRDGKGHVVYDGLTQFFQVPGDPNQSATGAFKVPDALPRQLAFSAIFLPTAAITDQGMVSAFPGPEAPAVVLSAYTGNLDMNSGVPQSVFTLPAGLTQLQLARTNKAVLLTPGKSVTLPNGLGTVTFDGYKQWIQLNVAYDPGKDLALASAILAVLGLLMSLGIRRRRVWVRVTGSDGADATGATVSIAGLARAESTALGTEITSYSKALRDELRSTPSSQEVGQ
jgi:cytochrome c biogenesis protein